MSPEEHDSNLRPSRFAAGSRNIYLGAFFYNCLSYRYKWAEHVVRDVWFLFGKYWFDFYKMQTQILIATFHWMWAFHITTRLKDCIYKQGINIGYIFSVIIKCLQIVQAFESYQQLFVIKVLISTAYSTLEFCVHHTWPDRLWVIVINTNLKLNPRYTLL